MADRTEVLRDKVRRAEEGGDDERVQEHAQDGHDGDGDHPGGHQRQVVHGVQEIHPVHADHDELGIADPHNVDDAEDIIVEAFRDALLAFIVADPAPDLILIAISIVSGQRELDRKNCLRANLHVLAFQGGDKKCLGLVVDKNR